MADKTKKTKTTPSKTTDPKKGKEQEYDAAELAEKMKMLKSEFLIIMDRGNYKIGYKTTVSKMRADYQKYIVGK